MFELRRMRTSFVVEIDRKLPTASGHPPRFQVWIPIFVLKPECAALRFGYEEIMAFNELKELRYLPPFATFWPLKGTMSTICQNDFCASDVIPKDFQRFFSTFF